MTRIPNIEDLISFDTAHDVRNLRPCLYCQKLGNKQRMVCVNDVGNAHVHGRCYLERHGAAFYELPDRETDKVCLGDVGAEVLKRLIEKRQA